MLVRDDGVVIGQASHAWISGQIAGAWAAPIPYREHLILAATQHDVGMAEWDRRPTLDAETGLPTSFMRMPLETHLELWTAAPRKLVTQSHVAATAVSLHGTKLYERRDLSRLEPAEQDAVRAFLAEQSALRRSLGDIGHQAEIQELMFTWDWLSLGVCLGWAPSTFAGSLTLHAHTVTPWPFTDDRVTLVCEGKRLTQRATTEEELHGLLDRTPAEELRFTLTRAPSGAP